jgi:flagellar M-ring protein FliF
MEAFLRFLRELGQTRLIALVGAAIFTLALIFFITTRITTPSMTPIYTDLSIDDSAKIVAELEKQSIPYELRANGTQILVPADQMLRLRLSLAQVGLPSGGSLVGYEIFDRSETMGTSSFVMNINMLRALEGELSRTIASLSEVEWARVHLVVPKPEMFSADKQEPTASIVLKLRGVSELNKEQIGAVTHLVATAVPGLKPSKITLVDSRGHMLAGAGGDETDTGAGAATAEDYRTSYENHLKNTIESLLDKSLGPDKVKVTVSADINFDRVVTNSETYNPEGQVVRSVQEGEEKEQSTEKEGKDNTTVANNLPGAAANQTTNGSNRLTDKTDTTTNYEISKTVENHVQEPGKVNKLSVAVLVDGNYTQDKDGKPVYAPRTDAEQKQIDTLVKSAMGYDEKRGDQVQIVNMRFSANPDDGSGMSWMEWLKADMHSIIQTLALLVVAVLVFLVVIRPLMNRLLETPMMAETGERMPALAMPGGTAAAPRQTGGGGAAPALSSEAAPAEEEPTIDLSRISGRVKSSTYNRLNELVDKNPDEALNVIRQWAARRA